MGMETSSFVGSCSSAGRAFPGQEKQSQCQHNHGAEFFPDRMPLSPADCSPLYSRKNVPMTQ